MGLNFWSQLRQFIDSNFDVLRIAANVAENGIEPYLDDIDSLVDELLAENERTEINITEVAATLSDVRSFKI